MYLLFVPTHWHELPKCQRRASSHSSHNIWQAQPKTQLQLDLAGLVLYLINPADQIANQLPTPTTRTSICLSQIVTILAQIMRNEDRRSQAQPMPKLNWYAQSNPNNNFSFNGSWAWNSSAPACLFFFLSSFKVVTFLPFNISVCLSSSSIYLHLKSYILYDMFDPVKCAVEWKWACMSQCDDDWYPVRHQ